MYKVPFIQSPFEAILDDLGAARSHLDPIRTAAHAACARRRGVARREDPSGLAAILSAAEDPFPALRQRR